MFARSRPSPHPLDDLGQLDTIGLGNEVYRQPVGGPCLARPDDGTPAFLRLEPSGLASDQVKTA